MTPSEGQLFGCRDEILHIAEHFGAHNVRLIPSLTLDSNPDNPEIDILVSMESNRSLFDVGGMLTEIQQLVGRKINVVVDSGLPGYIRDQILDSARSL